MATATVPLFLRIPPELKARIDAAVQTMAAVSGRRVTIQEVAKGAFDAYFPGGDSATPTPDPRQLELFPKRKRKAKARKAPKAKARKAPKVGKGKP